MPALLGMCMITDGGISRVYHLAWKECPDD